MSNKDDRDNDADECALNRRNVLLGGTSLAAASVTAAGNSGQVARAQEVLPLPEPPFKGIIGRTYKDSVPDKIPIIKAPDGAPTSSLLSRQHAHRDGNPQGPGGRLHAE